LSAQKEPKRAGTHGSGLPSISPAIRLPGSEFLIGLALTSMLVPSWVVLNADGCFSSTKRSRVATLLAAGAGSNITALLGSSFFITLKFYFLL
jgi:hypothetical protein